MSDVKLAKRIIKDYSTGLDGFSVSDCTDIVLRGHDGEFIKNSQCKVVRDVLGLAADGAITKDERAQLATAGLSKRFIKALAGDDGKKALRSRVAWLSKFYLNEKHPKAERNRALSELSDIGADAKRAVPAFIKALSSDDKLVRARAAIALGRAGSAAKKAVPMLIDIVTDGTCEVERMAAAQALGRIRDERALPVLVDAMMQTDCQELRPRAAVALGVIGSEETVYDLLLVWQDENEDLHAAVEKAFDIMDVSKRTLMLTLVRIMEEDELPERRAYAASAFGRLGKSKDPEARKQAKRAAPSLFKAFKEDPEQIVRKHAGESLAIIGVKNMFEELSESATDEALNVFIIALEKNDDPKMRRDAAKILGDVGSASVLPALIGALEDPDEGVRIEATMSILIVGKSSDDILKLFCKVLAKDGSPQVRARAAHVLGKFSKAKGFVIESLARALRDEDPYVRQHAVHSLGSFRSKADKAFKDVAARLEDSDIDVRKAAVAAVIKIDAARGIKAMDRLGENGADAINTLVRALEIEEWNIKRAAIICLGNLREKAELAVPNLTAMMINGEKREKVLAAVALGRIGSGRRETVEALIHGTLDDAKKVRKHSRIALDRQRRSKLMAPLMEIMGDADVEESVRSASAKYLGSFGANASPAVPRLIGMLESGDEDTRIMAAYVIASIGPDAKDAQDALLAAREGGSEKLKKTAAIALDKIGYEEPKADMEIKESDLEPVVDGEKEPAEVEPEKAPVEEEPAEEVVTAADLVEVISSGESADRRKAAMKLSKMGKGIKKVQGGLITLLKEGDDLARELSAIVLFSSKANSKKVLKAWVHALADSNSKVNNLATAALNKNAKKAAPFLIVAIKKGEEANKIAALKCLAPMGKLAKPAIKTIAKFLDSESASLRKAASDAIMKLGKHAAPIVPNLIAKLESEKKSTRTMAAIILWKLGAKSKHVIKAFIKRLDDEDKGVRTIARMVLAKIGGDVVPFLVKAYGKGSFSKKIAILGMLSELGAHADEAMDFLLEVIGTDELAARRVAASILVRLGSITEEYVEELSEILLEGDDLAREQAAFILWKLGPGAKDAKEALVEATKDEAGRVSEYAKKALAAIDSLVAASEAQ